MAKEGIEGKRQITAVFAATMDGGFLPPQLVYHCLLVIHEVS